ncbi:MAG: hypothetical protein U5R14_04015 [Gemmatimonadota bacterium]|nr:hypothetical protein [Gemmatimonadota bacterium]
MRGGAIGGAMSRMRWMRSALLAASWVALACGPLGAQGSFSLGAGFGSFTGGDFSGTPPGVTVGGAYHIGFEETFDDDTELALGIDYSRYGDHGFVGATKQLDYAATLRRRMLGRLPELLLGIRFGYSTRSLSLVEEPAHTDGFLAGPVLSLRAPTGLGWAFDLSLDVLYHSYEELIMYASREYGTDQDGFRVVLRAGVLVPVLSGERGRIRESPNDR